MRPILDWGHIGLLEEDGQEIVEEAHAEQGRRQQGQQDEGQEAAVRQQAADLRQRQPSGRGLLPGICLLFPAAQQAQGHQGQAGQDDGGDDENGAVAQAFGQHGPQGAAAQGAGIDAGEHVGQPAVPYRIGLGREQGEP